MGFPEASDCGKEPAFTTDCSHDYKRLQKNGDRIFYACEHCGATKVVTEVEEKNNSP